MPWTIALTKTKNPPDANGFRGYTIKLTATNELNEQASESFELQGFEDNVYIADRAKSFVDRLTAQDNSFTNLTDGAITPKQAPPPPPPVLTQDQIDLNKFLAAYKQKLADDSGVKAGALDPNDQATAQKINDDLVAFKNAFKPGYEVYLNTPI